jgi:tetratricopeptide (TPR) repeat protein
MAIELDTPGYLSNASQRHGKARREWQEALPRVEAAARKYPNLGLAWFNLGFAYLALDQGAQAVKPYERAVALNYRKGTSTYNLACAHAMAGQIDQAFTWLDRAFASGFDNWHLIREDADLDALRTDPRFRRYLELARNNEKKHWDHN